MSKEQETPFQHALDVVEQLPFEDQEILIGIIRQRLIERRRAEIAANAEASRTALREGRAKYGSVEDLRRDLSDPPNADSILLVDVGTHEDVY
jgi:hypothetical protein